MKRIFAGSILSALLMLTTINIYAQSVVLGNGVALSVFSPMDRSHDHSVYEVIYLSSQIGISGNIGTIGFQRVDGSNTDSIENVNIYMKVTNQSTLVNGNYNTTGYTLVYSGSFPNNAGSGWREVNLQTPFAYATGSNLQVLIAKGYQLASANTPVAPRWYYTNINPSPARARRYYDDPPFNTSTALTTTVFTSNARITFPTTGVVEVFPGAISVFPNPSDGKVTFDFDESNSSEKMLTITDVTGALVYKSAEFKGEKIELDLDPGTYLYFVKSENSLVTSGKVIVTD